MHTDVCMYICIYTQVNTITHKHIHACTRLNTYTYMCVYGVCMSLELQNNKIGFHCKRNTLTSARSLNRPPPPESVS